MYNLLQGVRILDLTAVVLGPYATQIAADFGAEVIKIETREGDLFRTVRPGRSPAMGAGYLNLNKNKKSVVIDLKSESGLEAFCDLVSSADVVVHNMRPAAAAKLKIDFETLSKFKPDLIYCFSAGFGKEGRNAKEPAYDDIIQASSGVAKLNQNERQEPRFLPTIICDKVGGLHLALAILGGIAYRARTGKGCEIEAPMFESMVSFMMVEQMAGKSFEPPLGGVGYDRLLSPYRRPFKTKDGYVTVLPYNSKHWSAFFNCIGREDMATADWVLDPVLRSENVSRLYEIVSDVMPSKTTAEWLKILKELDIPNAPITSLEDLFEDDHLKDVELFKRFTHPTEGELVMCRSPFRVTGLDEKTDAPAPNLGEHTDEVLNSVKIRKSEKLS